MRFEFCKEFVRFFKVFAENLQGFREAIARVFQVSEEFLLVAEIMVRNRENGGLFARKLIEFSKKTYQISQLFAVFCGFSKLYQAEQRVLALIDCDFSMRNGFFVAKTKKIV